MRRLILAILLLLCLLNALGCDSEGRRAAGINRTVQRALFKDVSAPAGIRFTHSNGESGKFYFLELTPAGCAFFDFDNDGWLDILLIQSGPSDPIPQLGRLRCGLYRNKRDGSFEDVTADSGLDRDLGYAHGMAVGDYDNDGSEDLFITSYGRNFLFRNTGVQAFRPSGAQSNPIRETRDPRPLFEDVTERMSLDKPHSSGYATSAAFGDYDNDGRLDLYVCYYCPWTWSKDRPCYDSEGRREYCTPQIYEPDSHRLFRNEGSRFVDVSDRSGIGREKGRGLAVSFVDYDADGRQDIYVANDLNPAMLWRNKGDGTFRNVAIEAGCAYDSQGRSMAGMGIGIADYDHSGRGSLFVTNFSGRPNMLFRNLGGGLFDDASTESGVGPAHLKFLSFGTEFLDYDADAWADLIVANGHVQKLVDLRLEGVSYRERKQLFHNSGRGKFKEITAPAKLGALALETVSRGLATGDFDNDGRVDVLVSNQNSPAQLFRNLDSSRNHWVSFRPIGTKSNRSGAHASFIIHAGGVRQTATARAGSSYLSHSDRRVYFGLGNASKIDRVDIRWPSGARDELKHVVIDRIHTVTEGRGITSTLGR